MLTSEDRKWWINKVLKDIEEEERRQKKLTSLPKFR